MKKRSLLIVAASVLFAVIPAQASFISDRGASGQGSSTDAFFEPSTTVNGVNVTPFDNKNQDAIYDIFEIPSDFTSGVSYTLTFTDITAGYGIFACDNGTNDFALSAEDNVDLGNTCTAGPIRSNDAFVSADEVGNTSTISFVEGPGAPSTFFFWTTDQNLLSIEPASSSVGAPEPSSLLLLAFGFAGVILFRRRLAAS